MTTDQVFEKYVYHSPDGCWYWTGYALRGYGTLTHNKKVIRAHRLSYMHFVGEIIGDNVIMHLCDNKLCVNPHHLKQGTQLENIKDRQAKNRMAKGSRINGSRLTDIQVMAMRDAIKSGHRIKETSEYFKIKPANCSRIVNGFYWKHVRIGYDQNPSNINRKPKRSSIYAGVHWDKYHQRWRAAIQINGKIKKIGRFKVESEAGEAYQKVLLSLNK